MPVVYIGKILMTHSIKPQSFLGPYSIEIWPPPQHDTAHLFVSIFTIPMLFIERDGDKIFLSVISSGGFNTGIDQIKFTVMDTKFAIPTMYIKQITSIEDTPKVLWKNPVFID